MQPVHHWHPCNSNWLAVHFGFYFHRVTRFKLACFSVFWNLRKGIILKTVDGQLFLTLWAEMGASAGYQNSADWGLACTAGLAGAEVDAMLQLEESADAVRIHIIGYRGTAEADGVLKHGLQSEAQALELSAGESTGAAAGTDAGAEEAFIGINVAYAGEQGLVEQSRLDGQLSTPKKGCELLCADCERLLAG